VAKASEPAATSRPQFNLSAVFATVARSIPETPALVWRDRRMSYSVLDRRIDGVAHFLAATGLGCHAERPMLAGHQSGQDHVGLYLRNGSEYLEAMIGAYRARTAPFNVSYRYVEDELAYLLNDAQTSALIYHAEFAPRVAEIFRRVPTLEVLIQVADDSDNPLLPGAVDYDEVVAAVPPPGPMPAPLGDDLYMLYTGGTTGMPKGVLWRQHDIFLAAMGGRPFGADRPFASYAELAAQALNAAGRMSVLMIPPLMHGSAQWTAFNIITMGGRIVLPDDVRTLRPAEILALAQRERVTTIPVVGDAIARPLVEEVERGGYDLSGMAAITNGGAPLSPTVRARILAALPHVAVLDAVGSSESGLQLNTVATNGSQGQAATFTPQSDTAVLSADRTRVLQPGEGQGWLARRDLVPLGYLGDEQKTANTFPTVDGVRWSVPGDRAAILADGSIELLGRDSITINSGGEKIFVEEVERAIAAHPGIHDVVVVGRPSRRWGSEVVAVVAVAEGHEVSDDELATTCRRQLAGYKVPKAFIRRPSIVRSPAGKADYRWAAMVATDQATGIATTG
jgi:3-oxocholest-4-en-26-oate---CoA ligase